ncbi:MAG TPA: type I glyceraldehyde-3-phosphate dehydrogenase [Candidatus Polarisedimenticolia bacterium]|jgi:glyceraldehyde 3-phosphate dehydrogenase|nr:type I glyceraldehyde-3-phosphate dehydrogenase [Candidatus Polarisedimenticolia bacterium]
MTVRVGINGFGRIGRLFLRAAKSRGKDFDFVAINDLADVKQMALLLRYDSIHGPYPGKVGADGDDLVVDDDRIRSHKVTDKREGDPFQFPWGEVGADVVVESTGIFRRVAELERHLAAGAKKVVLTVPAKDPLEATVVMGVNDGILKPSHRIVSNSSCTTNCAAPVAKVLQDLYGIREGFLTTVHAYTNDQRLFDHPHKDARRGRMAPMNIVPTSTGAAKALGLVIPALKGKLEGLAFRVPVPSGSVVDLTVITEKRPAVEEIHAAMKKAADGPMKGILQYTEDPIVSADIIGNPHSSIYDSLLTQVPQEDMVKIIAWYDNEWGYAMRLVDLVEKVAAL